MGFIIHFTHPNRIYSFDTPRIQTFSIPDKLAHYIATHPSKPQTWMKLIQTCKYFFTINPLVALDQLVIDSTSARVYRRNEVTTDYST